MVGMIGICLPPQEIRGARVFKRPYPKSAIYGLVIERFSCPFNDVAAIMVEPMSAVWPHSTYLESLKRLAHNHGALLILMKLLLVFVFSWRCTRILWSPPDLAFEKALAMVATSAVVGRAD